MSDRAKRILGIVLFFGVTAFLAYGVYFMIFRPDLQKPNTDTSSTNGTGGILPESPDATGDRVPTDTQTPSTGELPVASPVAQGGPTLITRLTQSQVLAPKATKSGSALYYDPNDGFFYQIANDGSLTQYSDAAFPNADSVILDKNAEHAVLEFPDGSNIIYNFDENRQITMPAHWTDFEFSPTGDRVEAKAIADAYNSTLVVMSTDGTRAYSVQDMGANADKVTMSWSPNGQFIALSNTGPAQSGLGRRAILLIDQDGEAPGSIIIDGTNFSSQWSPSGSHLLYSVANPAQSDRPGLWYVNASGQDIGSERKYLDVATWSEKCVFKNETYVLCGVPRVINDYEGYTPYFNDSTDDLYEINVLTGRKKLLAAPTITSRMFNLSLSEDQSTMYFTDQEGRLNYIRLE